ncbi:MAG TPA: histidine kinase [Acidobacteriaceae bacterium]|nr:histidine kinase [Acidobacteriaceae bacterium]
MYLRVSSARSRWGFVLIVTNLAVLTVMFVLLAAGELRTTSDFLHSLAYSLIFANLTGALTMLVLSAVLEKIARRRGPMLLYMILGIVVITPLGCLAALALLVAIHLAPSAQFWSQYLHILRIATPLGFVFGLGSVAYSSLATRLEITQLQLREKELAEERTRKLAAEARLRSLESWIHPHFLFNTLNSISALIAVDPVRAEQIVGRLAILLRASLDSGSHSLIPLRQEIELVESYLDIERARLGPKLHAAIDVPAALAETPVPPMSLQSLVENAVKYGITPQPEGGQIRVIAAEQNGSHRSVRIDVRDSGPGFELASIPAGHGLDKLVQRLDALFGKAAGLNVVRRDGFSVVEMVVPRR